MCQNQQVNVHSLKINQPLESDLTDGSGVLLLRAGVVITQQFIERLVRRGITTVTTQRSDQDKPHGKNNPTASEQPTATSKAHSSNAPPATTASQNNISPNAELTYNASPSTQGRLSAGELNRLAHQTQQSFDQALHNYLELGQSYVAGHTRDLSQASQLLTSFQNFVNTDPALVLMLLRLRHDSKSNLYTHSIKSALLSMTLAQAMGFNDSQANDVGVAALVHDLGMLRIPESVRLANRPLNSAEWQLIQEHPTHTLNMLDRMHGVTDSIKTAAYQVHERCNASGYPRRRPKQFIHPAAKIIAVSDAYCALTANRPHRAALSGHDAMKTVLKETASGLFDRAVTRAALDTLSLFPVGSYVGLSDGRPAQVLRSIPGQSVKPVVVVIKNGKPVDWELDLTQVDDLKITQILEDDCISPAA